MAIEGLAEERPWLGMPSILVDAPEPPDVDVYDPEATPDPGVFVGVRPEEVIR